MLFIYSIEKNRNSLESKKEVFQIKIQRRALKLLSIETKFHVIKWNKIKQKEYKWIYTQNKMLVPSSINSSCVQFSFINENYSSKYKFNGFNK